MDLQKPISFPDWQKALAATDMDSRLREKYRQSIIGWLSYLKSQHAHATAQRAKDYLATISALPDPDREKTIRDGLRWFFSHATVLAESLPNGLQAGRSQSSTTQPESLAVNVPSIGEMQGTAWHRKLVETIRTRHLLIRTEATYCHWARRFAVWLAPRTPPDATDDDVRAFLTHLAVERRVARATQQQALNAVVFLLRESLAKTLGDFSDFKPARLGRRTPVVLTLDERDRLFDHLSGTTRLLAAENERMMTECRKRYSHLPTVATAATRVTFARTRSRK